MEAGGDRVLRKTRSHCRRQGRRARTVARSGDGVGLEPEPLSVGSRCRLADVVGWLTLSVGSCCRLAAVVGWQPLSVGSRLPFWWRVAVCVGTSALPCTGPLEGPNFPSEDRDLPYLAGFQVKIAIEAIETNIRQIRQL